MIHDTQNESKMVAALELAEELGWPVLPCWWVQDGRCACGVADCGSPGKHPIGELVPKGLHDATTDPEIIRGWWVKHPQANPAVRTGDRFWALDLDGLDGIRAFAQLADAHPDLPDVPRARTGGGGQHLYFAADERIKNAAKVGGASIDVRGKGGYVLVPPSDHVKGSYSWELLPTKYELQPAPAWLVDHVLNGKAPVKGNGLTFTCGPDGDLATHLGVGEGHRNEVLCQLVGTHLAAKGASADLLPAAIAWGARCRPPLNEKEVHRTVYALAEKHAAKLAAPSELVLTSYADIEPEPIEWLWLNRIPLGKLTVISGDPGVGKSYMAMDIAARISAGRDFPDGSACDRGRVIYATCEDGPADTIRGRLDLLQANVANVYHLEGVRDGQGELTPFRIDRDLPVLERALERVGGVRSLTIDPISGFLGNVDSHNNAEVRAALAPLALLAEKYRVALVVINHLTKKTGTKAVYRSQGSLAFVAAARAAWAVALDPDDTERRLLLPVKLNLAFATGLAYRISDAGIEWEPNPVLIAVDDLDDDSQTPREEAKSWLQATLAGGSVPVKTIQKKAKADGINERTLRRAKKEIGVISTQSPSGWAWAMPEELEENRENECFRL